MKAVFHITYTVTGQTELTLPDDVDVTDPIAVHVYILDHWRDVRLPPYPQYVPDSDTLDETFPITVTD